MLQTFCCVHYLPAVRFELGGVVQAVVDLCQAIAAHGQQVVLITQDATDVPKHWQESAGCWPRIVQVSGSRYCKPFISRQGLKKMSKLLPTADVFHLHTPWEISNLQVARVLRTAKIPYVLSMHGMLDDWSMRQKSLKKRLYLTTLGKSLLRNATAIHLTAKAERNQVARWISLGDRGFVQPLILDLDIEEPLAGSELALQAFPQINPNAMKILFLSRVHSQKGIEALLAATALLRKNHNIQLLIAGPATTSYRKQLDSLTANLGVNACTEFLGMVRGAEKRSLYQLADVFVLPTHQENFGLVLVEALASGTPVITTRGTDIWRELKEAGAWIVAPTPQAIADAISDVLRDPKRRYQIGQLGKRYVSQWLDRDEVAAGYERMYRETIALSLRP